MNTSAAEFQNPALLPLPAPSGIALFRSAVLMVSAGLMLACAFPPVRFSFLLPFAIALMLFALRGVTMRHAFYLGFACGMSWFAAGLYWFVLIFSQGALTLWAIASLYPALFCMLFVYLRERLPAFPFPLLAAMTWTAIEYFRSELTWPNFGFFGLGYALADWPTGAFLASFGGTYALSFLIVLLAGGMVRRPVQASILFLLFLLAALFAFPARDPALNRPLKVHLVQAMSEDEEALFRLSQFTPGVYATDVILWPEYSFVHDPRKDQRRLWPQLQNVARGNRSYFVFGAKQEEDATNPAKFHNTAFLLDRAGNVLGTHVKNHPIHFIRDGMAGREAKAHSTELGRLGIAICFDLDFPDVTRRLVQDGAEVILAPSNNPLEWGRVQRAQQLQMIQMRAIECGRWIAAADVAGFTGVIAPNGQVAERAVSPDETAINARVGRETGQTLYVRGGWRFGPLCLLGLASALAFSFRRQKRNIARSLSVL